jgi:hypothetical protein
MATILGIGLNSSVAHRIDASPLELDQVSNLATARPAIDENFYRAIIIDAEVCKELSQDVSQLLGATPLTTKILVITHHSPAEQHLVDLGVQVFPAQNQTEDLMTALRDLLS